MQPCSGGIPSSRPPGVVLLVVVVIYLSILGRLPPVQPLPLQQLAARFLHAPAPTGGSGDRLWCQRKDGVAPAVVQLQSCFTEILSLCVGALAVLLDVRVIVCCLVGPVCVNCARSLDVQRSKYSRYLCRPCIMGTHPPQPAGLPLGCRGAQPTGIAQDLVVPRPGHLTGAGGYVHPFHSLPKYHVTSVGGSPTTCSHS